MSVCLLSIIQVLLPTYNLLDGAQSLLEVHKVGRRLVGDFGVKAILPRKFSIQQFICLCTRLHSVVERFSV